MNLTMCSKLKKYLATILIFLGLIFLPSSTQAAYTWTERQPGGNVDLSWYSLASDADGSNLIAGVDGGRLYISTDYGVNWTETQPAGATDQYWDAVASDSTGTNLIAGVWGGRIYISSNGGSSWTETQPAGNVNQSWNAAASDADGTNLIVGASGGRLYTSSNSGSTWTERQPAGNVNSSWSEADSNSDGSVLSAIGASVLYVSTNSGATWTAAQPGGNMTGFGFAAMDLDGSNIITGIRETTSLYVSTNSGSSWTETNINTGSTSRWGSGDMSDDGSIIIVGENGPGRLFISTNSGTSWEETQPAGNIDQSWAGVTSDSDGSLLAAISSGTRIYTGAAPDATNPAVSTLSPADGATNATANQNLVITFDEAVDAETGNIVIYKSSDDSVVETIDVTSGQVTGSGTSTITINPSVTLSEQASYYIQIAATAFDDAAGNSFAGIADETTWNFTIADATAPTASSFSPADNASDISTDANLTITFSEIVDVETGNIIIKNSATNAVVETIDVTSGSVSGGGTTVITINPSNNLERDAGYYLNIDATAFDDAAGNSFAGISDTTTWSFNTLPSSTISSGSARRTTSLEPSVSGNSVSACQPGDKFSTATGLPCSTLTTSSALHFPSCAITLLLKTNSRGEEVKCLQRKIKVAVDGIFGPITKNAVISFQQANGLATDGIVGPITRNALNK